MVSQKPMQPCQSDMDNWKSIRLFYVSRPFLTFAHFYYFLTIDVCFYYYFQVYCKISGTNFRDLVK